MIGIRKKYLVRYIIPIGAVFLAAAVVCLVLLISNMEKDNETSIKLDKSIIKEEPLKDNLLLYTEYDQGDVITAYVTVYNGIDPKTGILYDFDEMNKLKTESDGEPKLRAHIKIVDRDDKTIVLGEDGEDPNCTIELRGQSTRREELKSYKIKFYDGIGSFRGQKVLNLNKNTKDYSKVKQKFCFDYIALFPDMISMRTTFFHLYVKDAEKGETEFKDYGLFVHVEQPNKDFLRAHGLDVNGSIYKPADYEFFREEDKIKPTDDPEYDYEEFSKALKIRENEDNEKLIRMIEDVNNYDKDFNEVFYKYFDINNYLTWIAMNLLLDNYDTASRNYLLYSPSYSEKWYFLPWDYDKALLSDEEKADSRIYNFFGIERYWGNVLHNRFFRNPKNVELLKEKVSILYSIMTTDQTEKLTSTYIPVIEYYYSRLPDNTDNGDTLARAKRYISMFDSVIKENYIRFFESLERPMPFFLGTPKLTEKGWYFSWDPSYDLQGDSISYKLILAKDIDLSNIIYEKGGIYSTELTVDINLDKGVYYWIVYAYDKNNNRQIPFEYIIDNRIFYKHGIKRLRVE